jgi:hypothetical protein
MSEQPTSDLIAQIKDDYLEKIPVTDKEKLAVESFCAYAEVWLVQKRPVGVSPAAAADSAFSIRFADGTDISLFSHEKNHMSADTAPVRVTGNSGEALRAGMPVVDGSVSVTKGT